MGRRLYVRLSSLTGPATPHGQITVVENADAVNGVNERRFNGLSG
jgi:hypothetical protein